MSRDDPFGHWGPGEAYRTPRPDPPLMPICSRCGQRHIHPTPICTRAMPIIIEEDETDG